MTTPKVQAAADAASEYLNHIAGLFKPGAKLTLIVRTPGNDEADFTLSNDELSEAVRALERRMASLAGPSCPGTSQNTEKLEARTPIHAVDSGKETNG